MKAHQYFPSLILIVIVVTTTMITTLLPRPWLSNTPSMSPMAVNHHQPKAKIIRIKNKASTSLCLCSNNNPDIWSSPPLINDDLPENWMESLPPLVSPRETRKLKERLAEAAMGRAFMLQFGVTSNYFTDPRSIGPFSRTIHHIQSLLMAHAQLPVFIVAKMPREFARAGTEDIEIFDGSNVLIKMEEILKQQISQSSGIVKSLRSYAFTGGYRLATTSLNSVERVYKEFYISHECLHLYCEQILTKTDTEIELYHDGYASMICVSIDELMQKGLDVNVDDNAHRMINFLREISNPLGITICNDGVDPRELVRLILLLNPENKPGKIAVITKMGLVNIGLKLPYLIREVRRAKRIVTWILDPMPTHNYNTINPCSYLNTSTRRLEDVILAEVRAFFEVHYNEESYPGGVHLNVMAENEATNTAKGGNIGAVEFRLDASQARMLASEMGELLWKNQLSAK